MLQVSTDQVSGYIREKLTPDPQPDLPHTGLSNKQPPRRRSAGGGLFFYLAYCIRPHTSSAYRAGSGRGSRR